MEIDPYFWTQDNGAGAPIHFAVTYKQLDMVHHILRNVPECVNQRDDKGFTPLHRAAYLAQYEGYLEIYEYLLSEGADPTIRTEDYDPYLNPGKKIPLEVSLDDDEVRAKIVALEKKYAGVEKRPECHPDLGCWWTLYDYGLDAVKGWPKDYRHPYPEVIKRQKDSADKAAFKAARAARRAAVEAEAMAEFAGQAPIAAPSKEAPASPIAFLFPGQGSQAVGMINSCKDLPAVQDMLAKAKEILGYDLLEVCLQGPKSKIDDTVYSQPCLFVGGLAAVEKLRAENPTAVDNASCTAGLSLGEYTALVFAGVLSFEDGMKVVKVRAESMAAAAKVGSHGMMSIVGLGDADLEAITVQARQTIGGDCVCNMTNYLFPQGRVVSGDKVCLEEVQKLAIAKGALKAQAVAVSGAFHTSRMQSASDNLKAVLETVTVNEPRIPIYSNVTAKPFESADVIKPMLARQLVEPVMWENTIKTLIAEGKTQMFELGPGQQLKAMCKRIDAAVWKAWTNVQP